MKIGDRVKVADLLAVDKMRTNLRVGDIGEVLDVVDNLVKVKFDRNIKNDVEKFLGVADDTYEFNRIQLKIIDDVNTITITKNEFMNTVVKVMSSGATDKLLKSMPVMVLAFTSFAGEIARKLFNEESEDK